MTLGLRIASTEIRPLIVCKTRRIGFWLAQSHMIKL
jgi:hypothetical protein